MTGTNFKDGVRSRGIPAEAGGGTALIPGSSGKVFIVDSAHAKASDNNNGSNSAPLATLAGAEALISGSRGDIVIVAPTHTESWATLAACPTIAKAGSRWFFVRTGALVATFTVGSAGNTDATLTISGASVTFGAPDAAPIFIPGVDSVVTALTISGANAAVHVEVRDTSAAVEFVRHVTTAAGADNLTLSVKARGFIAGNACVNSVRLVGSDGARIHVDFFGVASTAVVESITTLSSDVVVTGVTYNSGTTDGSKNVVITGGISTTWYADIVDAAAGARFTGGSGAALASDDITAVNSALTTLQAEVSGGAGLVSFPAGAAAANGISLAEVLRYAQENIINGAGTALPSGASLWGALAGATGIPTFPAAAVPGNDVSLAEVLRDLWDAVRNGTGGSEPGTNKSIVDAIGFDGVAAIAASAGMLRTMAGTTFSVKKTLTSSAVTQAGVDVTAVSTVGDILIEAVYLQTDATGLAAGTNVTLETNNTKGKAIFLTEAVANLGANATIAANLAQAGLADAGSFTPVLETGKKVTAKSTVADCTGAGTVDVYLICRRLADNATLAAA